MSLPLAFSYVLGSLGAPTSNCSFTVSVNRTRMDTCSAVDTPLPVMAVIRGVVPRGTPASTAVLLPGVAMRNTPSSVTTYPQRPMGDMNAVSLLMASDDAPASTSAGVPLHFHSSVPNTA